MFDWSDESLNLPLPNSLLSLLPIRKIQGLSLDLFPAQSASNMNRTPATAICDRSLWATSEMTPVNSQHGNRTPARDQTWAPTIQRTSHKKHAGTHKLNKSFFLFRLGMAERAGFEPAWECLAPKPLSRRPRYDHFGTSPVW